MRSVRYIFVLLTALGVCACGAQPPPGSSKSVAVRFEVDGIPIACDALEIRLSIGPKIIAPARTPDGFLVPEQILKAYASHSARKRNNVATEIKCNEHKLVMSGLYPAHVLPGLWTAGIAYPTNWLEKPGIAPETGNWVEYLETNCNGCDPGVVVMQTQSGVPEEEVNRLRAELGSSTPQRLRDIEYALAVFHSDYRSNRDALVNTLQTCQARPVNSPEDDVCNGRLVRYLANLYWRGDDDLLPVLFNLAQQREDVVDDAGSFYSDLLAKRPAVALNQLALIPPHHQRIACAMAFKNELRDDPTRFDLVAAKLKASSADSARTCLEALRNARSKYAGQEAHRTTRQ